MPANPPPFAFFFQETPTTEIYTLSLHDALPISHARARDVASHRDGRRAGPAHWHGDRARIRPAHRAIRGHSRERSEEHTSELQSHVNLVCRLLLEKKKKYTSVSEGDPPTGVRTG